MSDKSQTINLLELIKSGAITQEDLQAQLQESIREGMISGQALKSSLKNIGKRPAFTKVAPILQTLATSLESADWGEVDTPHASLQVIFVVDIDKTAQENPIKVMYQTVSDKSCNAPAGAWYAEVDKKTGLPANKNRYTSRVEFIHTRAGENKQGFRTGALVLSQKSPSLKLFTEVEGKVVAYDPKVHGSGASEESGEGESGEGES